MGGRSPIVPAMRAIAAIVIAFLLVVPRAQAQQTDRWLVLPSTVGPSSAWAEPTATRILEELDRNGVSAWPLAEAAQQFEEAGSAPAAEVSKTDIEKWVGQSSKAIRNLAEGDYAKALDQLQEAQALSRAAAEELNREHERAQRMLDTCLYMVRVLLDTGVASRARSLAQECRQLVPRVEPTQYMHPPEVLQVLKEVDDSRAGKPRRLNVDSDPSGCAVRVNGVLLGETPLELKDLFPGEYRVQVECRSGRRGRVHTADVTTASTRVDVDVRFDRTVSTRPILHLRYGSASEAAEYQVDDAAEVGRAVPERAIILVSKPQSNVAELQLLSGDPPRRLASARIPASGKTPTEADVALAVQTLRDRKCTDFTSGEPVTTPCEQPKLVQPLIADSDWPRRRMPRGAFITGLTFTGLGAAGLATGYGLLITQKNAANDWLAAIDAQPNGDSSAEQAKWLNAGTGIIVASATGGGLLTVAMPLVLPKAEGVPWPAWLAGGLGLGAAAFAVAWGVTGDKPPTSCRDQNINNRAGAESCILQAERTGVAVAVGATAAPPSHHPLGVSVSPKRQEARAASRGESPRWLRRAPRAVLEQQR